MLRPSFALFTSTLLALLALVAGQGQSEIPAITGGANSDCGPCFIVGDIVGVVFGAEHLTTTQSIIVSVAQGRNGTNVTSTITRPGTVTEFGSATQSGVSHFSVGSAGVITGSNGDAVALATGSIITINGATLTSPTSYQLFSVYSVTSTILVNGDCTAVQGNPMTLSSAVSIAIPLGADANFALSAQQQFASSVGLPTCSPGGGNLMTTSQSVLDTVTTTSTTMGPMMFTPQPISTQAAPTAAATTETTTATVTEVSSSSLTSSLSVSTTIIVMGNATSFGSTGGFPAPTIAPFPGEGVGLVASPLLVWSTGILSIILTAWIL